jgi:hypothetical protein
MSAYNLVPSYSFSASGTNGTGTPTNPSSPTTTPSANATQSHPTSGMVPPAGAVLVSVNGAIENSFSNLTSALASLPADTTSQVIFIYPGSYTEQVAVNGPGPVTVVGYQTGSVGQIYTDNQVTITYSRWPFCCGSSGCRPYGCGNGCYYNHVQPNYVL